MREKRSRREADVYKAKIGRDAIIDIHVRRYSSKPYYFHPKSTGALVARGFKRGLIYLQEAHRRFAGVSQSVRQTERQKDRHQHVAVSTATPHAARARRRRQVPPSKYRTATPHHTKATNHCRPCISVPPPSLTQEKKVQHFKERVETFDSRRAGCQISILRPGSSIRQQAPASWKAGTGSLAVSRQDSPSPTREVGSPALSPQPQSLFFAGLI
jgi:hypothetical protein